MPRCPDCEFWLITPSKCERCGWEPHIHNKTVGRGFGDVAYGFGEQLDVIVALRHIQREKELMV